MDLQRLTHKCISYPLVYLFRVVLEFVMMEHLDVKNKLFEGWLVNEQLVLIFQVVQNHVLNCPIFE